MTDFVPTWHDLWITLGVYALWLCISLFMLTLTISADMNKTMRAILVLFTLLRLTVIVYAVFCIVALVTSGAFSANMLLIFGFGFLAFLAFIARAKVEVR